MIQSLNRILYITIMVIKKFSIWCEQQDDESLKLAIKSTLGELADGKEDAEWLGIDTGKLSRELQDAILNLGELKRKVDPNRYDEIREAVKSGIKLYELVDLVLGPKPSVKINPHEPQNLPDIT
jgi:hypothetical protein